MPIRTYDQGTCGVARSATTVLSATVTLVLAAACTSAPAPPASTGRGPAMTITSTFQSAAVAPPAGASSPVDAAERWLVAYRSASWIDGTPTAWIERVRPYVTKALDAQNKQQYADAGGGADWQAFVAQQCTSTVTDVGAVIPAESPGTATDVNVQVTGTVRMTCDVGQAENPTESASATLVVIEDPDRSWRVNQRIY